MPYQEKETEKLYYAMGEVAKILGVNASLIRFWEKEFDIIQPKKNNKRNRMFTRQDLDNLLLIQRLVKERGFTLQGAKDKLKQNKSEAMDQHEMVKSLEKVKAFLLQLKEAL
jgi:DNA-binding transcriptional MerR regulator